MQQGFLTNESCTTVLYLGNAETASAPYTGMRYFWHRTVMGFRQEYHCRQCIVGKGNPDIKPRMVLPATVALMDRSNAAWGYLCGVAHTRWEDNLHIFYEPVAGETIEATTYDGVPIRIVNGRRLPIPWIEDGFGGYPKSYTTCRNWQVMISIFGFTEGVTPIQGELLNPKSRTRAKAERR